MYHAPKGGDRRCRSSVDITVRTLLVFAALLLVTRLEAKKQIGQLTYFHYVTGIVLGSIAAQAVVDRTIGLVASLFALVLWVVLMATMSWVSLSTGGACSWKGSRPLSCTKAKSWRRTSKSCASPMTT